MSAPQSEDVGTGAVSRAVSEAKSTSCMTRTSSFAPSSLLYAGAEATSDSHPLAPADTIGQRDANAQPPPLEERLLHILRCEFGHEDYVPVRRLLARPQRVERGGPAALQRLASLLTVDGVARGAERAVIEGVAQGLHCRERPAGLHALKRAAQRAIDGLLFLPRLGLLQGCPGALNQRGAGGWGGGGGSEGGGGRGGWRGGGSEGDDERGRWYGSCGEGGRGRRLKVHLLLSRCLGGLKNIRLPPLLPLRHALLGRHAPRDRAQLDLDSATHARAVALRGGDLDGYAVVPQRLAAPVDRDVRERHALVRRPALGILFEHDAAWCALPGAMAREGLQT
eukprot:scaffold83539_cov64-Phaeocystis_antarctica.AAC.4